jgi:hypothetical protein
MRLEKQNDVKGRMRKGNALKKKHHNMFRRIKYMKEGHQLLMAVIISVSVIAFWRGIWGLMDIYIFPEKYELSLWLSLVIGIGILVTTHYATKELM